MDYKYIEQLVDCYFEGETTLEEEQILRKFFAQEELPEHLRQWQPLFREQYALSEAHLDASFDERILALTGEYHVKAQPIPLRVRLRPLYRVAAFLAFAIVIGTAVEYSTNPSMEAPAGQVAGHPAALPAPRGLGKEAQSRSRRGGGLVRHPERQGVRPPCPVRREDDG